MTLSAVSKCAFAVLAFSACHAVARAGDEPSGSTLVATDLGLVRGVQRHGAVELRGIPYAAPPVGDLRWASPQPATPWSAVLDAKDFGPACPQAARFGLTEASDAEDCLTIYVTGPLDRIPGEALPVLVWIHGGAFVGGGSSLYRLDALARARVVVVSMNYRLGVFGFMPHPAFADATNGDYGLEDQRAALAWVKRNIEAFGGDPRNITVGGESAGAGSMCVHLSTPEKVGGLIDKAIIESGGCLFPLPTVQQGEALGLKVAADVGCEDPAVALQCLRKAPVKALIDAGTKESGAAVMGFSPTIGNETAPRSMLDAVQTGRLVHAPVLMGGTRDELRLYVGYDEQAGRRTTRDNFAQKVQAMYGASEEERRRNTAQRVLETYPLQPGDEPPAALGTIMSDFTPHVGVNNCLYLHTADALNAGTPVYEYEFADRNAPVLGVGIPAKPDPGFAIGAAHSTQLNYLFPNLSNTRAIDAPDLAPASQKLADQMILYWTSFARAGSPSAEGGPEWPRYSGPASVMEFEPAHVGLIDAGTRHHCAVWTALFPERLR
jgi:para-nitrobenzyl esterase